MLRSNCTFLAVLLCFFRSRYVRAATLLSISQARKWNSVVAIFKIEVARDVYVTKQRIMHFLGPGVFRDRLLGSLKRAPSAALRLPMVACIAARNHTFASYLSLKLSVLPLHQGSKNLFSNARQGGSKRKVLVAKVAV